MSDRLLFSQHAHVGEVDLGNISLELFGIVHIDLAQFKTRRRQDTAGTSGHTGTGSCNLSESICAAKVLTISSGTRME